MSQRLLLPDEAREEDSPQPPPLKGGQGRSADEVALSGGAVAICMIAALFLTIGVFLGRML